jgi:hypothetical protein
MAQKRSRETGLIRRLNAFSTIANGSFSYSLQKQAPILACTVVESLGPSDFAHRQNLRKKDQDL